MMYWTHRISKIVSQPTITVVLFVLYIFYDTHTLPINIYQPLERKYSLTPSKNSLTGMLTVIISSPQGTSRVIYLNFYPMFAPFTNHDIVKSPG